MRHVADEVQSARCVGLSEQHVVHDLLRAAIHQVLGFGLTEHDALRLGQKEGVVEQGRAHAEPLVEGAQGVDVRPEQHADATLGLVVDEVDPERLVQNADRALHWAEFDSDDEGPLIRDERGKELVDEEGNRYHSAQARPSRRRRVQGEVGEQGNTGRGPYDAIAVRDCDGLDQAASQVVLPHVPLGQALVYRNLEHEVSDEVALGHVEAKDERVPQAGGSGFREELARVLVEGGVLLVRAFKREIRLGLGQGVQTPLVDIRFRGQLQHTSHAASAVHFVFDHSCVFLVF
eukprot:693256-Prorocentrum_minimum.AAC.54